MISRFIWWFCVYFIQACGWFFLLSPLRLPPPQRQKLYSAALQPEVLIVFNPGGWGDAELEQADDFTPILEGMRSALVKLGYPTGLVQYTRALSSLAGRCSGVKEQITSFKHSSIVQVEDMRDLAKAFPDKRFILAGFSTGGGLTGRAMKSLADEGSIYGIMVGVPGWFPTHVSSRTLVLDNSNRDPVSCGNTGAIAIAVLKAPLVWLKSKFSSHKLSLALAMQIPHHEYAWSSPEVGPPIIKFLERHFPDKSPPGPV